MASMYKDSVRKEEWPFLATSRNQRNVSDRPLPWVFVGRAN